MAPQSGEERGTRLMKAGLDICLLAFISEGERYAYELIGALEAEGIGPVKEGSVYPMLRRMEKEGLVSSRLASSQVGPARKYYRMLPEGDEKLRLWSGSFLEFARNVGGVLRRRGL